jgi:hypothetical protein
VPDFAHFIAAAVSGPQGQPSGCGVLAPQTLAEMFRVQPGATDEGLAYGVTSTGTGVLLQHFGATSGWNGFFSIDTGLREGLVMSVNSSNGFPLNAAVQNLWWSVLGGGTTAYEPAPEPDTLPLQSVVDLALTGLFTLALLIALVIFVINLRRGRRVWSRLPSRAGLVGAGVWLILALFWVYWFYTSLPLFFPPSFPDLWHTPQVDLVLGSLLAWVAFSAAAAWCPKTSRAPAPSA